MEPLFQRLESLLKGYLAGETNVAMPTDGSWQLKFQIPVGVKVLSTTAPRLDAGWLAVRTLQAVHALLGQQKAQRGWSGFVQAVQERARLLVQVLQGAEVHREIAYLDYAQGICALAMDATKWQRVQYATVDRLTEACAQLAASLQEEARLGVEQRLEWIWEPREVEALPIQERGYLVLVLGTEPSGPAVPAFPSPT